MHNVKMYTTPTCVWCGKVKEFFKQNNVQYKEIDVSIDDQAAMEMIEKTGQMSVPVIDIDGNIVLGYNVPQMKQFLGV